MTINTKNVQGRRELKFQSLDEVIAEAEKLVNSPQTRLLGNKSLDQILNHLAIATEGSIDGTAIKAPWFIRLVGPFLKGRLLKHKMPAGFKLPARFEDGYFPKSASPNDALQRLRNAVARLQNERMTAKHPVLGQLNHDEWNQLHLRHSELHLSFVTTD